MNTGDRLRGRRVVVTSGGTREAIDPVRYLGNRSSGKMGSALAAAAAAQGAVVTLITTVPFPGGRGIDVVGVESAEEMLHAVLAATGAADVLIMAAAVADYRPAQPSPVKLKKHAEPWALRLVPTTDILRAVRDSPQHERLLVVGFAAETDDLVANATGKLRDKGMEVVVVNDVSRADIGMGADHNEVTVIDDSGVVSRIARAPKPEVALRIVELIAQRLS